MGSSAVKLVRSVDWGDVLFIGGFVVLPLLVLLSSFLALRHLRDLRHDREPETVSPPDGPRPTDAVTPDTHSPAAAHGTVDTPGRRETTPLRISKLVAAGRRLVCRQARTPRQ